MKPWKIHVLYEYGQDLRPHGTSYLRLLRPLSYPVLAQHLQVTSGLIYTGEPADMVIVDRLWRPDITVELARKLIGKIRAAGARFVYAIDDNLFDLPREQHGWISDQHLEIFLYFLEQADAIWVTTPALKDRLSDHNQKIFIIQNALDERLLVSRQQSTNAPVFGDVPLVLGYMGTYTHDDDLKMILPALANVCNNHPDQVKLELVGVVGKPETLALLEGLPHRIMNLLPGESEYPLFQLWFAGHANWDIALSPLLDTPFNLCKSDIKYLDYCAIGAAGIYSRVAAYRDQVQHRSTGWLAENTTEAWTEALETLITDHALRHSISTSAIQYLYRERTLARCAPQWLDTIDEILAG